jgi:hypothetical protein
VAARPGRVGAELASRGSGEARSRWRGPVAVAAAREVEERWRRRGERCGSAARAGWGRAGEPRQVARPGRGGVAAARPIEVAWRRLGLALGERGARVCGRDETGGVRERAARLQFLDLGFQIKFDGVHKPDELKLRTWVPTFLNR